MPSSIPSAPDPDWFRSLLDSAEEVDFRYSLAPSRGFVYVSPSAPIVLTGQCGGLSIPVGQVTIDSTGAPDGGSGSGTYNEPSCGLYSYSFSGGFFGREFRMSSPRGVPPFVAALLSRQALEVTRSQQPARNCLRGARWLTP